MKNINETITITKIEYENIVSENTELNQKVQWLMEQLKLSKDRQFGASSEKTDYSQISIFNEAELEANNVPEPKLVEIEKHYRKVRKESRLPEDLAVKTIEHDLPEDEKSCCECGHQLNRMGREVRRELKFVPAQAVIVEHVSFTYSCRDCENNSVDVPIVKSKLPKPIIKGSFASPEAIAYIMSQKFVMSSPLYRLEQEFKRNGIDLSRQTMSNWLMRATKDWLTPIYTRLHEKLLAHEVLHADETTLQVLKEPDKKAQSKSYMWLYRTSGDTQTPVVIYEYQPDRSKKRPAVFLKGFNGYLHADGYEGYHSLPITVVGCWAHARRKWVEAVKVSNGKDSMGAKGLQFCNDLFELERKFASLPPEERYEERQKQSKPVVDAFFSWLDSLKSLPKTALVQAVYYMNSQRKYLLRFLEDGRLEISNNRAERSIKPFVIGRKNWLFANTPGGAKTSAIIYSIIETAKDNNLNPYEYLAHVFKTAPNINLDDPNLLDTLLPVNAPNQCRQPVNLNMKSTKTDWDEK
jgi:transposase